MADNQDRDQRTQDATPQRIRKAREEGQIAFSAEFMGGILLAAAVGLAWGLGGSFFRSICDSIVHRISDFETVTEDPRMMVRALIHDTKSIGIACMCFVVPIGAIAMAGGFMQTGFNLTSKPLALNWGKLSVTAGFGRIFSSKSLVRGGFSIFKATMVLGIITWVCWIKLDLIAMSCYGTFTQSMYLMCEILLHTSVAIAAMLLAVGMIDLAYQKWKHLEDLKMSVQDIKDENKESEGDPLIKARVRRLQAEMGRKRMLADVPKASVVITNPTHFAVAIQYDRESMDAPVVIAKGADFMAKKIIQIAKENGVAVVERKPVARFLYANVDIGGMIPFELYQAVAEILNIVSQVRKSA